ncbi:MAG: hypothetical protein SH809_04785 [Rhodothermales bacterium]|nr:hypothetical protein [Rhodothermales bacterium]
MSKYLFLALIFFGFTFSASAQPGPNDPPQVDLVITLSTPLHSTTINFGLDVRATEGHDEEAGLREVNNLPPWTLGMEARFQRTNSSYTLADYRFGDGSNITAVHTIEFRKDQFDNGDVTISWNLPPYATGVLKDVINGSIVNVPMAGAGNTVIPDDGSGDPIVGKLLMTIIYTNIPDGVLPVELTAFDALVDGSDVVLAWETASETNNAGFEVQQLVGDSYQTLGFVSGFGTTNDAQSYSYRVTNVAAGVHSFRLKQIDFDGAFAYSDVATAELALDGMFAFAPAAPNPFNPQTQFSLTVGRQQHVRLAVYDMIGRQVALLHEGSLEAQEAHLFRFEANNLPSGRYFIQATGEFFSSAQAVVLSK